MKSELLNLRMGGTSQISSSSERGHDFELLVQEIAEGQKLLDQYKVILDSDPRKTAGNGALQGQETNEEQLAA